MQFVFAAQFAHFAVAEMPRLWESCDKKCCKGPDDCCGGFVATGGYKHKRLRGAGERRTPAYRADHLVEMVSRKPEPGERRSLGIPSAESSKEISREPKNSEVNILKDDLKSEVFNLKTNAMETLVADNLNENLSRNLFCYQSWI